MTELEQHLLYQEYLGYDKALDKACNILAYDFHACAYPDSRCTKDYCHSCWKEYLLQSQDNTNLSSKGEDVWKPQQS